MFWLPPLLICSITFVFASLATINYCKYGPRFIKTSSGHTRGFSSSTFVRPLMTSTVIVLLVACSVAFSFYARVASSGGLQAWTSWAFVHAHLSTINVISDPTALDLARIELLMWTIPASSLVILAASAAGFFFGAREEMLTGYRSVARWFRTMILRRSAVDSPPDSFMDIHPHVMLSSPVSVHRLTSMFSDTLRSSGSLKVKPARISIPDGPVSPTPPSSDDSDAFMQSTLTYLESPTGREALALGLPELQRANSLSKPPSLPIGVRSIPPTAVELPVSGISESPGSRTNSILAVSWPRPPSVIPVSPVVPITISPPTPEPSIHHPHHSQRDSAASLSPSVTSSTISALVAAFEPGLSPHSVPPAHHRPPFADAGLQLDAPSQGIPLVLPRPVRRVSSRDNVVTRNLSLGQRRERVRLADEFGVGAIYMSVVKETA